MWSGCCLPEQPPVWQPRGVTLSGTGEWSFLFPWRLVPGWPPASESVISKGGTFSEGSRATGTLKGQRMKTRLQWGVPAAELWIRASSSEILTLQAVKMHLHSAFRSGAMRMRVVDGSDLM